MLCSALLNLDQQLKGYEKMLYHFQVIKKTVETVTLGGGGLTGFFMCVFPNSTMNM